MPTTHFQPETHGFAFINSWTFAPHEMDAMHSTLNSSIGGASNSLSGLVAPVVKAVMQQWVGSAEPIAYGLCGGMTFAALDYFTTGKKMPRGKDVNDIPQPQVPSGKLVRDYLWKRQLESMADNFPTLLYWMAMLHVGVLSGGARWLLDNTKDEWHTLKQQIDGGSPCPICLIGTSVSPFHNHQVLAYGYDEAPNGNGTGMLYLYDMNCPGKQQTVALDFRGTTLVAQESCADAGRGALRGFFCETYHVSTPPEVDTTA